MKDIPELSIVLPVIRTVRGQRVVIDSDLARLYGVPTGRLNQQFHRNRRRFPADFAFELTRSETETMMSQIVTSSRKRNRRRAPVAYTEYGAVMAANILKSDRAIAMSVEIVRAFIQLRKMALSQDKIVRLLADLETAVSRRLDKHDQEIAALFGMLEALVDADPGEMKIGSA